MDFLLWWVMRCGSCTVARAAEAGAARAFVRARGRRRGRPSPHRRIKVSEIASGLTLRRRRARERVSRAAGARVRRSCRPTRCDSSCARRSLSARSLPERALRTTHSGRIWCAARRTPLRHPTRSFVPPFVELRRAADAVCGVLGRHCQTLMRPTPQRQHQKILKVSCRHSASRVPSPAWSSRRGELDWATTQIAALPLRRSERVQRRKGGLSLGDVGLVATIFCNTTVLSTYDGALASSASRSWATLLSAAKSDELKCAL